MVRKLVEYSLYHTGILDRYIRYKSKRSALILAYHRVNTREYLNTRSVMPGMYVSDNTLEMHIKCLKDIYKIVELKEIVKFVKGEFSSDTPLCALTFDDGWKDVYQYGFPILKKHNVPATVFLVGNSLESFYIDCFNLCFEAILRHDEFPVDITNLPELVNEFNKNSINRIEKARCINNILRTLPIEEFKYISNKLKEYIYENINENDLIAKYSTLSLDEIIEMQNNNISFGYHSKNHYMLTQLEYNQVVDEITAPLQWFAKNNVIFNGIFCYPDSKYDDMIICALKEHGYYAAVSLTVGLNVPGTNSYLMKRINVHEGPSSTKEGFLSLIAYNL